MPEDIEARVGSALRALLSTPVGIGASIPGGLAYTLGGAVESI